MIVIDASAAIDYLSRTDERADWIRARLDAATTVHVPALFDLEVLQSLRGLESGRVIGSATLRNGLGYLVDLRATRHSHLPFLARIWGLRDTLTAYDAAYIALAEALDAPLITTDVRLAKSSGHRARIETPPA